MKRTLIVGAGQACATILTEIFNAKHSPYEKDKISAEYDPVCIVDDNRRFIGREISGIRVVGMTYEIPSIVAKYKIEQIMKMRREKGYSAYVLLPMFLSRSYLLSVILYLTNQEQSSFTRSVI